MITLSIKDKTISRESLKINSFGFMLVSVCLIAFCCYLARAASINEFTRVESCFSECSREMLQRQNYIAPLYHGIEFFDKPILTYWLIILCYKAFGVSVFAARLPSIISAVLCIGLVASFARKIYGNFVGILAGAILATSIGFSDMASAAMSDMPLCLFEFISLITLYLGCENSNKRTFYFCIASVAMSLGFLTKSLIALAFPIGTFLIFLIAYKKLNVIRPKHFILGISIFSLIILPWHIMVYKQCGIQALSWMYIHEQIQRFSADVAEYNFRHPFYYMTLSLLSQLLPWSVSLPVVIWKLVNDLKQNFARSDTQCTVMLLTFLLLDIVLFTLSKSNWGYYNLPACPAASIIIGKYLADWLNARSGFLGKYTFAIPASIFVGTCVLSLVGSWFWTMKLKHEAQHNFAEIIANNYPKNQVLIHMDLFAQYFLCDWILFKTQQTPKYYYHNDLLKALTQHKAFSVILPKNNFDTFPESLKSKLKILAIEQYKFIPFKLSPLKQEAGTDCKTTLVLAINKHDTGTADTDTYDNYNKSVLVEKLKINPQSIEKRKLLHLSTQASKSKDIGQLASWWLAKAYFAEPKLPDVVILGSSQLGPILGIDSCVYKKPVDIAGDHRSRVLEHDFHALLNKRWKVFIGALPGAMISDQLVVSRALFSTKQKPKLVAITFSPRDFIDNSFSSSTDTEPFAFFARYADSDYLRSVLEGISSQNYPVKEPYNYYSDSKSYSYVRSPLTLGEPFELISPDKIIIRSGCDYGQFEDNTDEYRLRYKNPLSSRLAMQMACFESLLKYLAQQHIQVVAFNSPISAANRKLLSDNFWKSYDDQISEICKKNGADYISADRVVLPFQDNEFIDGVHLNFAGGLRWSRVLAVYIANKFGLKTFPELLARVKYLK